MRELLNISDKNCVVFSTHSPFMIDKSCIERHYIVKKLNEITTLTKSTESNFADEEVLFQALGYTVFCNIKNTNVLFEGYWDNYVYQNIKQKDQNKNIGHIFMGGVKNAQFVGKMIELQDKKYYIISDSDKPAKESKSKFLDICDGKWIEYGEIVPNIVTLEDFVKNDKIKSALHEMFKLNEYSNFNEMDLNFVDDLVNNKLGIITKKCCEYNKNTDVKRLQNKFK